MDSKLKVGLLTTDTYHHKYYVKKISEVYHFESIIIEEKQVKHKFETFHPFEKKRDNFEKIFFLIIKK